MASMRSECPANLVCPVCCELFGLPVQLKCSHNCCRACLLKHWERKGCRECPVCRAVSASERPPINLELKLAADSLRQQSTKEGEGVCAVHNEKLKVFCHNDEELICLVCHTSRKHKIHRCGPIEEAAQEKRVEMSVKLASFQSLLKVLDKTKEQWTETKLYIKTQADESERVIQEQFKMLHQFLREEEETRLKKLRQEEQTKTTVMGEKLEHIQRQITRLNELIVEVEGAIAAKDLPFLLDYKDVKKRVKCDIREPGCIRDILINTAQHLGLLGYGIWKKMANLVQYVPVTMDPNTAQANLLLTAELTHVQYSSKQLLPDNLERCNSRMCVLGDIGIQSGKHSWTVGVGQSKDWYIGVASESIKRKSTVFLNPSEGFWVIGLCNGDAYWAQTSPRTRLNVKKKPERIIVEVDYDKGKVIFINGMDLAVMHTFKDKFVEKLLPYFSPGVGSSPLTICPMQIIISVQ